MHVLDMSRSIFVNIFDVSPPGVNWDINMASNVDQLNILESRYGIVYLWRNFANKLVDQGKYYEYKTQPDGYKVVKHVW